jgi:hypothetical protein
MQLTFEKETSLHDLRYFSSCAAPAAATFLLAHNVYVVGYPIKKKGETLESLGRGEYVASYPYTDCSVY